MNALRPIGIALACLVAPVLLLMACPGHDETNRPGPTEPAQEPDEDGDTGDAKPDPAEPAPKPEV